jgi:uncharacterized caspase-like protein
METSISGTKFALLIGINDYMDEEISKLKYCENDVVELGKVLENDAAKYVTKTMYMNVGDINFKPFRSNIMAKIKLIAKNASIEDTILFYFAGHGMMDGENIYLLPYDARKDVLVDTAIDLKWVNEILDKSSAKVKILVIDACKNDMSGKRDAGSLMSEEFERVLLESSKGYVLFSSCQHGESSYEDPDIMHGIFTYYFIEGLKGDAFVSKKDFLSVSELNTYIYKKLKEWSISKDKSQTPLFHADVAGDPIIISRQSKKESSEEPPKKEEKSGDLSAFTRSVEKLRYMSSSKNMSEITMNLQWLEYGIYHEDAPKTLIERIKHVLTEIFRLPFTDLYVKGQIMELVSKLIEETDIKIWIKENPNYKRYLIREFRKSHSWAYAATMSQIIYNLFPIFTESDYIEILNSIESNEQIFDSYGASSSLGAIVTAIEYKVPLDEYPKTKDRFIALNY